MRKLNMYTAFSLGFHQLIESFGNVLVAVDDLDRVLDVRSERCMAFISISFVFIFHGVLR